MVGALGRELGDVEMFERREGDGLVLLRS